MPECEFCKKSFSTKSNVTSHQKRAKYCLLIQKNQGLETNETNYECNKCNFTFIVKKKYDDHIAKCVSGDNKINDLQQCRIEIAEYKILLATSKEKIQEKNSLIEMLKEENKDLKSELALERTRAANLTLRQTELLAQKTNTTTTNINNGKIVLTHTFNAEERIKNGFKNFTVKDCKNATTMAKFVVQNVITDENGTLLYICTDKNRKNFRYRNANNEEIHDPNATTLIKQIKEYAKDTLYTKSIEVLDAKEKEYDDPIERFEGMNNTNTEQTQKLGPKFIDQLSEQTYVKRLQKKLDQLRREAGEICELNEWNESSQSNEIEIVDEIVDEKIDEKISCNIPKKSLREKEREKEKHINNRLLRQRTEIEELHLKKKEREKLELMELEDDISEFDISDSD